MAPPNKPAHLARKVVKRQKKFVRHQSDRKIAVKVRSPLAAGGSLRSWPRQVLKTVAT